MVLCGQIAGTACNYVGGLMWLVAVSESRWNRRIDSFKHE